MSQALSEGRSTSAAPERWQPSSELDLLNERMRRILEQTFGGLASTDSEKHWLPLVDIEEEDDAYVLEADLPGVKRGDVKIEQIGNELLISGEFKERQRKGVIRRQTRRIGKFAYRVALPEQIDADKIEAKLDDGVLTVRVPKAQRAKRRSIEIKA
jgi:HSP20 family protein